jgi:hypothetical protein
MKLKQIFVGDCEIISDCEIFVGAAAPTTFNVAPPLVEGNVVRVYHWHVLHSVGLRVIGKAYSTSLHPFLTLWGRGATERRGGLDRLGGTVAWSNLAASW